MLIFLEMVTTLTSPTATVIIEKPEQESISPTTAKNKTNSPTVTDMISKSSLSLSVAELMEKRFVNPAAPQKKRRI